MPGIFLEDFSGHFFPTKMRRKNLTTKSVKNLVAQKENRTKSVLPKADPKKWSAEGAKRVGGDHASSFV